MPVDTACERRLSHSWSCLDAVWSLDPPRLDSPGPVGARAQLGEGSSCRMAPLLLDLGTERQDGPKVNDLLLAASLRQRRNSSTTGDVSEGTQGVSANAVYSSCMGNSGGV